MSGNFLNARRHGHCDNGEESPTYRTWKAMRRRCTDAGCKGFNRYGGRGISFVPQWRDFSVFLADMGERPSGTFLDRENGNMGYSKDNCRWVSRKIQNRNRLGVVLTIESARAIYARAWLGEPHKSIAADFGCSPQLVSNIKTGKAWADAAQ